MYAADLRLVPAVPYRDPGNYVRYSERLAEELRQTEQGGVIWANQFDNTANRMGHYGTTGPEFWDQTNGQIDGFVLPLALVARWQVQPFCKKNE